MCGCNGETLDECGVCDNDEANDCEQDCLGVWGGDAQIDDCGVCNGENLDKDCNGICFGDAYLDDCGVCDNIEDNNNTSCTGCTTLGACNFFDLTALLQCERLLSFLYQMQNVVVMHLLVIVVPVLVVKQDCKK